MARRQKNASCRKCNGSISYGSKSGLCRPCSKTDPEIQARRTAGIQKTYDTNPAHKERQRERLAALNRTPERRAASAITAKELRLWEIGVPKSLAPDVRKKQAATRVENRLAHIPREYREMYKDLMRKQGAAEASRLIQEHHEAKMAKFTASLKEQSRATKERQN